MEEFDPELQAYYSRIKEDIKLEHAAYMEGKPEIKDLLNDFVSSLLLKKPGNIYDYAKEYFSYFNTERELKRRKPLVIVGNEGISKTAIVEKLTSSFPSIFFLYNKWTSRKPKIYPSANTGYNLVTLEQFEAEKEKGSFVITYKLNGDYYGILKDEIDKQFEEGKIVILEISKEHKGEFSRVMGEANYLELDSSEAQQFENEGLDIAVSYLLDFINRCYPDLNLPTTRNYREKEEVKENGN